jgi:hypothetical protein
MAESIGSSTTYKVGVPSFNDPADIQTAIKLLHYGSSTVPSTYSDIVVNESGNIGIAGHLKNLNDLKAPKANPTFTGTVNMSGATVSLPSASVTSANIVNGTIVNEDISSSAAIAVSKLASSAVTIGSTSVTLGTTAATIAGLTLTLPTIGSGGAVLTGSTSGTTTIKASAVAGTTTVTVPGISGTLITNADSQTVTNSMIKDGDIANTKLANSVITINGTQVALGGSYDTVTEGVAATDVSLPSSGFVANSILYNSLYNNTESLAPGLATQILGSSGTAPTWIQVANAQVASNAAIAYSKLNLAGTIVNADIKSDAAIADSKLATISTPLKVSNAATTATNLNTSSAIVARDSSGNFSAGTITATLKGNVTSDATTNGKVTFSNTSGTTYTPVGKIFVQATEPSSPATGDIWMW